MAAVRILVLLAATGAALTSVRRMPAWCATVLIAAVAVVVGIIPLDVTSDALGDLAPALAFLAVAVPLAILLDETGFFAAVAAMFDDREHLMTALWLLAAGTTIVFNLDAAVVLLTPLYVRIAERRRLDPVAVGVIPALLASLASSVLPVSNLTNLIAVQRFDTSIGQFLRQMALPSAIAIALGGVIHLRHMRRAAASSDAIIVDDPVDRRSLRIGVPIVVWLVLGFTFGHGLSVPPWAVAAVALAALMVLRQRVPWRAVPIGAIGIATGLGVVAAGAAAHLPVDDLLSIRGVPGELATFGVFALGANAINNLPALLIALPSRETYPDRLWAVLLGVNLGPTLWVTGALSTLLWQSTMTRLGHHVSARSYARLGARVGVPVLVAVAACRAAQLWLTA